MPTTQLHQTPLRNAAVFPLARAMVTDCLDVEERPNDALFKTAFDQTLAALEPAARGAALSGITGHVAESVTELILVDRGWTPVWDFEGPGRHGVDLLMLDPDLMRMFAIEVKGTLRPRRWPTLRRGELGQMEVGWLDKEDNPGMNDWGVTSDDLHGGIVLVNLHDLAYKIALTRDFSQWHPVEWREQLEQLDWLGAPVDRA